MNAETKKEATKDSTKNERKKEEKHDTEEEEDDDEDEDEDGDDEEDGDDDEEEEESGDNNEIAAEPLATTRSRRSNAGNRMSKMIQDEEDEFYANLYGGFHEEDDDMDFDDEEEADVGEVEDDYDVDSDFSIDETDEIAPEHQAVEDEPKRKRGVYRDPKPKGASTTTHSTPSTASGSAQLKPKPSSSSVPYSPNKISRAERSFRDSTRKKTEETIKNFQTGSKRKRRKRRNLQAWKPLTQEEMLAEAKVTEEENLKSLETYQRLESERLKKIKQIKKSLPLPYVTYTSTIMPDLKETDSDGSTKYYSRNFMTYFK